MVRCLLVTLVLALPALADAAELQDRAREVLERAARFYAPPTPQPALIRVAWVGTHDVAAADQARRPELHARQRAQHLLVIDPVGHRAALDTQQVGSDGTPGLWRHQFTGEISRSVNRKSGRSFERKGDAATHGFRAIAWRLPRLAIAEMQADPQRIRSVERRREEGRAVDVVTFEVWPDTPVEVLVEASGEVAGYAYWADRMRGRTRVRTRFKPSMVAPALGRVPRGLVRG